MVMVIDGKKMCSKCKKFQSVENFHKNRYNCDGYAQYCKVCRNEYYRNYQRQRRQRKKQSKKRILTDSMMDCSQKISLE